MSAPAAFRPNPILEGDAVRLRPAEPDDAEAILEALRPEATWRFVPWRLDSLDDAREWIRWARTPADDRVTYVVMRREGEAVVGSTSFLDVRARDRALEIGATFLAPAAQRTRVNAACKRRLLGHAFDDLGAVRVTLKTDGRNERSQRAIERLGAVREGVLRKHRLVHGYQRDTVTYSILAEEWPGVRDGLDARLAP